MPIEYCPLRTAWSISFNPKKYSFAAADVKANIFEADRNLNKGKAVKIDYFAVESTPFGIPNCVIFRPETIDTSAGKRYLVEINGVGTSTVRYFVEFVRLD